VVFTETPFKNMCTPHPIMSGWTEDTLLLADPGRGDLEGLIG